MLSKGSVTYTVTRFSMRNLSPESLVKLPKGTPAASGRGRACPGLWNSRGCFQFRHTRGYVRPAGTPRQPHDLEHEQAEPFTT